MSNNKGKTEGKVEIVSLGCPSGTGWLVYGPKGKETVSEMAMSGSSRSIAEPVKPPTKSAATLAKKPAAKPISETAKTPAPAGSLSQSQNQQPGSLVTQNPRPPAPDPQDAQIQALLTQLTKGDRLIQDRDGWYLELAGSPVDPSLAKTMIGAGVVVPDGTHSGALSWGDLMLAFSGPQSYSLAGRGSDVSEMAKANEQAKPGQLASDEAQRAARRALGL